MQKKKWMCAAGWLFLFGAVSAAMLLLSYITLYSDDYMYAMYFDGGLQSFWSKTVDHYHTFNGRALVHFFAELFLAFKTKLYSLVFPILIAFTFLLAHSVQHKRDVSVSPAAAAISVCLLLALPVVYLNQSLLWISGSFNYCFPVLLVIGYFVSAQRSLYGKCLWVSCLLGFLSGATTEQNGLMAILGGVLIVGMAILRAPSKSRPWRSLISIPFAILGYLSVMLAPGTFNRISIEGGRTGVLSILLDPESFIRRFYSVMSFFCGKDRAIPGAAWLLSILILLLSFLPFVNKSKKMRVLSAGFVVEFCYLLLLFFGDTPLTACAAQLLVCGYLMLAGVVLLLDRAFTVSGVFILAGLAALGIMIFADFGAYRTVMPTLMMMIAVIVRLGEEYLACVPAIPRVMTTAGIAILCAAAAFPTFQGYRANSFVIRQNETAVAEGLKTGEITLCTDYLDTYRHYLMFEGVFFFHQFRQLYDIPPDMPVHLEGEHFAHWPVVFEGSTFSHHAVMTNSVLYLPVNELFDAFETTITWDHVNGNGFHLERAGEQYYLSSIDNTVTRLSDGTVVVWECYTAGITDRDYIEIRAAAEFFGFTYTFDRETVTIHGEKYNG